MRRGPDSKDAAAKSPDRPLVDETLIDHMLSLSVRDRLRQNDRMVRTALALRAALARPSHARDD